MPFPPPMPDRSAAVPGYAGGDARIQVLASVAKPGTDQRVLLKADVPDDDPRIPTWTHVYSGAAWHERETHEMFGITFDGNPDLRNIYLPTEFEGHPLRKEFPLLAAGREALARHRRRRAHARRGPRGRRSRRGRGRRVTDVQTLTDADQLRYIDAQAADGRVNVELETDDGMVLNMGPQHPATHGTLRIVARLDGEQVTSADVVCGYMHRGYEKLCEVRSYPQVTTLVNRIDWLGSFANEVPFILAAEQLMEVEAPPRAKWIRTILFELSRIANVSLFIGDLALQLGAQTPAFYAFRDREFVLNQIEAVTGGRFHPNFDRIGGLKDDLPKGWIAETKAAMVRLRGFCDEMEGLVYGNEIFQTRTRGIGVVPGQRRARPTGSPAPTSAARASTGTSAATPTPASPTTSSTGRSGPTPTATASPAAGCASRRCARPPRSSTSSSTACPADRSWPRSRASSRCPRARPTCRPRTRSGRWATTSCRRATPARSG